MRIYTSYFYQIRFFTPNMIPLSTAIWDPKWYHEHQKQDHIFLDKRGVINGMRIPALMPGKSCEGECYGREACKNPNPKVCNFLMHYREQLDQIDFQKFLADMKALGEATLRMRSIPGEPIICLIVHEAVGNPCSERVAIQQWSVDNNYPILEWSH